MLREGFPTPTAPPVSPRVASRGVGYGTRERERLERSASPNREAPWRHRRVTPLDRQGEGRRSTSSRPLPCVKAHAQKRDARHAAVAHPPVRRVAVVGGARAAPLVLTGSSDPTKCAPVRREAAGRSRTGGSAESAQYARPRSTIGERARLSLRPPPPPFSSPGRALDGAGVYRHPLLSSLLFPPVRVTNRLSGGSKKGHPRQHASH